jgi:hypothetical protein
MAGDAINVISISASLASRSAKQSTPSHKTTSTGFHSSICPSQNKFIKCQSVSMLLCSYKILNRIRVFNISATMSWSWSHALLILIIAIDLQGLWIVSMRKIQSNGVVQSAISICANSVSKFKNGSINK